MPRPVTKEIVTCDVCGNNVLKNICVIKNNKTKKFFCNKTCYKLRERPRTKDRRICKKCNKEFSVISVHDNKKTYSENRKYCFDCAPLGSYNSQKYTGINRIKNPIYYKSDEDIRNAVINNYNSTNAIKSLGLEKISPNCYTHLYNKINELGLDISHWMGRNFNRTQKVHRPCKYKTKDLMTKNSGHLISNFSQFKKRLISEKILEYKCDICEINEWLGFNIILQLDHIDGDKNNNSLENLRLLCPNCHSMTPTFCGKNNKRGKIISKCSCGNFKSKDATQCHKCDDETTSINWPSYEELIKRLETISIRSLAKELGIDSSYLSRKIKKMYIQSCIIDKDSF